MEGLLSFILFAGFFYFMMRFGCGAHMAHGHHSHKKKTSDEAIFDPVCGVKITEDEGYGKLQDGILYRFCSKKCLDEFDRYPKKYTIAIDKTKAFNKEKDHDA